MKPIPPLSIRKLRAKMELKALSLHYVVKQSGVPYATASQILNGHIDDPARLARIRAAINAATMPEEVAA